MKSVAITTITANIIDPSLTNGRCHSRSVKFVGRITQRLYHDRLESTRVERCLVFNQSGSIFSPIFFFDIKDVTPYGNEALSPVKWFAVNVISIGVRIRHLTLIYQFNLQNLFFFSIYLITESYYGIDSVDPFYFY